jgi:hypothetical protein
VARVDFEGGEGGGALCSSRAEISRETYYLYCNDGSNGGATQEDGEEP